MATGRSIITAPTALATDCMVITGPPATSNNEWSFAGDGDRKAVKQMLLQPFADYNFPGG
jgi:hypothetical protein